MAVFDLSHRLDPTTPPFPGDPAVGIEVLDSTTHPVPGQAGVVNASAIRLSLHAGTHMDAPFHFDDQGATIDRVPLAACFGPAYIVRLEGRVAGGVIDAGHLAPHEAGLRATARALLDTGWYRRWRSPRYFSDHPVLSAEAARFLVGLEIELVGVDFPSVDRAPNETHRILLGAGVLIVENLTALDTVPAEIVRFAAFPLAVRGRDGSPVRAVAMPMD